MIVNTNIPIKLIPSFLKYFPILKEFRGLYCVITNSIYFRKDIYYSIFSDSPDPYFQSILAHETQHFEDANNIGIVNFSIKYVFDKKFRFEAEISAIKAQILFLNSKGLRYDYAERSAKALSSYVYLWCSDYETALIRINKIMQTSV
jgi:hypothetical protein